MKSKTDSYMIERSPNLWSFPPAGCTRVQSSGLSEGGMAVGADPPPSCAGASPLWPTCAGDIPTHKDHPWPGQSPRGDGLCLFCPCWSPTGYDNLDKGEKELTFATEMSVRYPILIQNKTLIVPAFTYFDIRTQFLQIFMSCNQLQLHFGMINKTSSCRILLFNSTKMKRKECTRGTKGPRIVIFGGRCCHTSPSCDSCPFIQVHFSVILLILSLI